MPSRSLLSAKLADTDLDGSAFQVTQKPPLKRRALLAPCCSYTSAPPGGAAAHLQMSEEKK